MFRLICICTAFAIRLSAFAACLLFPTQAKAQIFYATGSMSTNRASHTATLLSSRMVLIAGGDNSHGVFSPTAELFTNGLPLPPLQANVLTGAVSGVNIQFIGQSCSNYVLQLATNLVMPILWQSLLTIAADTNGLWQFTDTNLNAPNKFYRITAP